MNVNLKLEMYEENINGSDIYAEVYPENFDEDCAVTITFDNSHEVYWNKQDIKKVKAFLTRIEKELKAYED